MTANMNKKRKEADKPETAQAVEEFLLEQLPIAQALRNHLTFSIGKSNSWATTRDWYQTAAFTVRDHLMSRWVNTRDAYRDANTKRVYYLSLEFLIGRMLSNAALNLSHPI